MEIKENTLQSPYFLYCKFKGAKLLGFIWTGNNEILLISDKGVELYQVKNILILLKLCKSYFYNFFFIRLKAMYLSNASFFLNL